MTTEVLRRKERLSPRQAIVAVFRPLDDWRRTFALPLALDLLGEAVGVNGATLSLYVESEEVAASMSGEVPYGVEVMMGSFRPGDERAVAKHYAERGFSRVVFVTADTIGVSVRLLTTALSVVASSGAVLGVSPNRAIYLVGLSNTAIEHERQNGDELLAALVTGRRVEHTDVRTLEGRPRLSELSNLDELREALASAGSSSPRTLAQFRMVTGA